MRARRWWMLAVTCLSVIVVNLDLTILEHHAAGHLGRAPCRHR